MISASNRFLRRRAVRRVPSRPAKGAVLMPIVTERLGSSTVISGRALGSSGSASVSPIVMSPKPATAMSYGFHRKPARNEEAPAGRRLGEPV